MGVITDDLADCFPDILVAQPGSENAFGEFIASGAILSLTCYISGKIRLIRSLTGQEVVSSVKVIVNSINTLTTTGYRYTLPTRFDPRVDIEALSVKHVSDEDGPHHEVVFLP